MGGGGSYYDRDVTIGARIRGGYTATAQQILSRTNVDSSVLPLNRKLISTCKSPVVYAFDVTGSMDNLPKIICDKMPMIAGQLVEQKYLDDPMVSLAAVGDVTSDQAPLQMGDFAQIRELDDWLQKLYLEGGGGDKHFESYEFTAYYYARLYDMQDAKTPIFLFTGDEAFRDRLPAKSLQEHFGGQHTDVDAAVVFDELKQKFQRNVFLIHRFYRGYGLDKEIVAQWEDVLGKARVIKLKSDLAIADVTLGIFALAGGLRTLDEYIEDVKNRPLEMEGKKYEPQSPERLAEVRTCLELFASTRMKRARDQKESSGSSSAKNPPAEANKGKQKKTKENWKL